ncbi:helix-turn-helix domain-containing protein [Actinokineospora terrae]|uniref:DNA-binding transcriptional regulator, XRE-family HTH domain n=1 Tax=Actinokineospora terrae TaxID=155974 RepID=A0A1H9W0P7_9PSEU|nr:helix-turn-helix transcriptional regulator [Actinokineospora terrae]SES27359.1 DNA-binding transcriptional regulator, XRE-family HTH domain [Actinokineospora terrae]
MGAPDHAAAGERRCPGCGAALAAANTGRLCIKCHREHYDQLDKPPVDLGEDFFDTDEFRAAFESQHIGKVFRAYRYHMRHLWLFGKALNQELLGRWLGLTQAQISKLEKGKPEQNLETLRYYARTLHLPQHLLWFDLSTQSRIERPRRITAHQVPFSSREAGSVDLAETSEAFGPEIAEHIRRSQAEWLRVRRVGSSRGRELAETAAWLYPSGQRALGGHVLTGPGWLLEEPVELDSVKLAFSDADQPTPHLGPVDHVLPLSDRGDRYGSYSRAVRDLVRPRLLENRLSYRLLDVSTAGGYGLTFGTTTFFEVFDAKEYLAHEFKAAWLAAGGSVPTWDALPLRSALGDPFDPARMLMSPGISTLTIRKDTHGEHRFVVHQRDGSAVADGGGMCTVMPSGEFQPSSFAAVDVDNDFSLWRNIMREYSEEFLGNPEHDGSGARSIDYAGDEPFRSFEQARTDGRFRLWHYGLVMDPLTLGASQRTVAVVDGEVFDRLFTGLVATNDEGHIVGEGGRADMPFTAEAISRLESRFSASSLTLLRLAWRDRHHLLG